MKFAKIGGILSVSTVLILLFNLSICKSEPISVDYYGDACECGKPVSYHVQTPVTSNCGSRLINYGYKLKLPPPPSFSNDCPDRNAFDMHIQEPLSRTTSEIESHGYRILTPPRPLPCPSASSVGNSINLEYQIRAKSEERPKCEFENLFTKVDKMILKKPDCDRVVEGDCPCRKYKPTIDIVRSCTCHSNCGHFHETIPCSCGHQEHRRRRRDVQIEEYSLKGLMNDIFQVPRYIQQQKYMNHQKQQELNLKHQVHQQQLQQQQQQQQHQRRYQQNQHYLPRVQPPAYISDPLVGIEPISSNQLSGQMTTYVRPATNNEMIQSNNKRQNINQQRKKLIFKLKPHIKEVTKNIKYKLDRFFTRHSNRIPQQDRRVINKREILSNDQMSAVTSSAAILITPPPPPPTTTSSTSTASSTVSMDKINDSNNKPSVGCETNRILKNIQLTKMAENCNQQKSNKPNFYWTWDPVNLVSNKPSYYYSYYTPPPTQTMITNYQPTGQSSPPAAPTPTLTPLCPNLRIQRHLQEQQYHQPRITTEESNFMIEQNGNQYYEHVGRSSWPTLNDEDDTELAYIVGAASDLSDHDDHDDGYGSSSQHNRDYYYTQLEDILHRNQKTTKDLNQVEPHQLIQEPISLLLQTIGFMKEITNQNSGKEYENAYEYELPDMPYTNGHGIY